MIDPAKIRRSYARFSPHVLGAIALGAMCLAVAPAASAQAPGGIIMPATPMSAVPPGPPPQSVYVLGPDDQVTIHVVDVPDLSDKPQRIDPNGDLKLPMVGRIHASGMTIDELEAELRKRLKEVLNEPDVTVSVGELHSQTVSVIGAVGSSGVHQIRGRQTLIEILSLAGGVRADAGPVVRVVRRPEWDRIPLPEATIDPTTGSSIVEIDLKALLGAMSPDKNLALLPNDVVSIPTAEVVYVVGEVGRAGAISLSHGGGVTVMEALSASGGVLRTAKPSGARVLRFNASTQTRNEVPIDIQKIMQGKATDQTLLAGDILVVPDSTGKRVGRRAIDVLVQTGIMVGTYGLLR